MKGRNFISEITEYIFVEDKPERADIIFVPGGLWPEPMEKAAELYKDGYAEIVLPSGKYSMKFNKFTKPERKAEIYNGNYKYESEFLKDVGIKNGIKPEAIIEENRAEWTKQNAFFSRELTDNMGLEIKKAIICCKSFHAKRCLMFYSWAYPETEFLVCPVDIEGVTKKNWYKTEYGRTQVMGELSRCGGQFKNAVEVFAASHLKAGFIDVPK